MVTPSMTDVDPVAAMADVFPAQRQWKSKGIRTSVETVERIRPPMTDVYPVAGKADVFPA